MKIVIKKLHIIIQGNVIILPDNASTKDIKSLIAETCIQQQEQK